MPDSRKGLKFVFLVHLLFLHKIRDCWNYQQSLGCFWNSDSYI